MSQQYLQYGPQSGVPFTLANLAYSVTLTTGRQSAIVDNTISGVSLYPDYLCSANFTCGTSPQPSSIELWVFGRIATTGVTPVDIYPPYFGSNDAAISLDSINQKYDGLSLGAIINVDAISNRTYSVRPFSIASRFDGICPTKFGFFVTHNTFANLNVGASGNQLWVTPVTNTLV